MSQAFYKIIYNGRVNSIIRACLSPFKSVIPESFKIPPSGILKLKTDEGKVLKISTNQTSYITQLLFWNHYKDFEYTDIFVELIKKVSVFYDIGANIGFYSLLAHLENPELKIVAFEPAMGPLNYLSQNVKINSFHNIKIEALALSNQEGEIEFYEVRNRKYSYLEYNLSGEGNAGSKTTGKNFVINKVQAISLDRYIAEKDEAKIDLIKMDTEGTEADILRSSVQVLEKMKPIIICETLYNTIEAELEEIMGSCGYEFYNHTEKGLQKVKSIIRSEDNGVRNCFFVHPSKQHLIQDFIL